ncbi:MAG TPA: hypothetical protein VGW36_08205 [Pyrinomonadaceae bacterium]|nr:hypothetical protein [Pyrinomonadaceae bacterium]
MKYLRFSLTILVAIAMTSWSTALTTSMAQGQSTALERGYRTGYSDGYNAGYRDIADRASRDHQNKEEYQSANRSYNEAWGPVEDYRDGYQQGFEAGYAAGYDRHSFNSNIPSGLTRRGTGNADTGNTGANSTVDNVQDNTPVSSAPINSPVFIRRDSILLIELQSSLSTDATQQGDRFEARVIEPREFDGAILEGRVTRVKRPGKLKGSAELQLSFETIRMHDNRTSSFRGDVVEVVDMGNRDEGGTVDSEGGVRGRDSTKDDVSKVGATTGIGAIIGAIAGGGKGAAIGAAIGGSIGTAGVLSTRGKELRLPRGQQLRIRAATDTQIQ